MASKFVHFVIYDEETGDAARTIYAYNIEVPRPSERVTFWDNPLFEYLVISVQRHYDQFFENETPCLVRVTLHELGIEDLE